MKLLIVSSAPIVHLEGRQYMYGPYQKEMKIWAKYADEVQFCCPIWKNDRKLLVDNISFSVSETIELKEFDIKTISKFFLAFQYSVLNFWIIVKSMKSADHIHLRCPGNIGLLASIAQIFYPNKKKTTKYAGNWDPNSTQPWSYRLQKWILSNTFLTRNMKVLVYGEWLNQSKNVKSFFTASYSETEIGEDVTLVRELKEEETVRMLFVGTLSSGKQPLYAIRLVEKLRQSGFEVRLELLGDGVLQQELRDYVIENNLQEIVLLKGNQKKEIVKEAFKSAHFLLLPSKSEGWPKVVAEAMFWGAVPVATPVSCVPAMLDSGQRGILLTMDIEADRLQMELCIKNPESYAKMANEGMAWSREFSLERFEKEIKHMLQA